MTGAVIVAVTGAVTVTRAVTVTGVVTVTVTEAVTMTVTGAVYMKTRACPTTVVRNSFAEFHENPTNDLVADDVSQTDGRRLYMRPSCFRRVRKISKSEY